MLQPEAFWDRVTSGPLWVETDPGFAGTGTVIVDLVCTECDTRVAEVREHARVPLLVAWEKTPRTLTKQRGRANPGRDPEEGL
ncbi:MAG: hypothetical protein JOZ99_00945, partial [Actinobacteria bacterium]|nr:hypothetical protein [Actinomycetota bacterium]